jgi:hypothetical protein
MELNRSILCRAIAALGLTLFAGCLAHDGQGLPSGSLVNGTVSVGMTDAASDEIDSFIVDVSAIQLKKSTGAIVSVISAPVTVDLASLTSTTELMNVVTVPAGSYTSATITLDFTNATCLLAGQSTPAAIQDDHGNALTGTVTLPLQFGQLPLDIQVGKHRLLEFDFDLNQSVDVDATNNVVQIEPTFMLHIDGSGKKLLTLGTLTTVNTSASSFVGTVKTLHGVVLGSLTYSTDANTIFQVDGAPGVGAAGLTLLNSKPTGTWIQVLGVIDPNAQKIKAQYVEAGTGTYNGGTDIIEGHIVDRVGNPPAGNNVTFTVLGRSNNSTHTTFQFDTTFTVTTNFAATKVVRLLSSTALHTDDLNVGQHVRIFGALSGTAMNATTPMSVIREQESRAFGFATGAIASGTLTFGLQHIELRPESAFTWADSGLTPPDPANFTANVGTLGNALPITNGTAVEVRGFMAGVADANQDMTATTLIDLDSAPSLLFVKNLPLGFTVALTTSATNIQIAITGTALPAEKAIVDHGFAGVVALPTSPTPTIQPAGALGIYMLRDKTTNTITAYSGFDVFSAALGTALGQGATVDTLGAVGTYDNTTNTISAAIVSAVIE